MEPTENKDIDSYIEGFPVKTQELLRKVRETIRQTAPEAEECIRYKIPTYKLNGNLVHFAGYNTHIGFYPTPAGIEQFKDELGSYSTAKGSVQFPLARDIPFDLIRRIVEFRVRENQKKAGTKTKKVTPGIHFLSMLSSPAKRALENKGIKSLKQLSRYSEAEILQLHGIGPSSIPKLRVALEAEGLAFEK